MLKWMRLNRVKEDPDAVSQIWGSKFDLQEITQFPVFESESVRKREAP